MTTEDTAAATTAVDKAETAATTTENGDTNNNNNNKRPPKKDEVPIEDLYDLSKPIPRVDRPDKDAYEKRLQELNDTIDKAKSDRAAVQAKIDQAMAGSNSKSVLGEARSKISELKKTKQSLIEEKKAMRVSLDAAKSQTDKLIRDKKDVRSNIKFSKLEDIEKEIRKLQKMQETTSMSLAAEKKLISEMDQLQASKKYIKDLEKADKSMDTVRETRKSILENIKAKDKEIDKVSAEINKVNESLKEQNDKDSESRAAIQGLFQERDDLKATMSKTISLKEEHRTKYREENNNWYNYQRAVRAQKKIAYEAEKKKREEEKAAYQAKLDAEEAKKIPYEEEQELCEYLATYLERTYVKKEADKKETKSDVIPVTNDPFAGLTPVSKKDTEEEEFLSSKKKKKKRVRAVKEVTSFTLSVDIFEQFGLINLSPPTKLDMVEASIKELREKKEWYKQQPRGTVPTAADVRKQRESKPKPRKVTTKGGFSLNSDEFAPLGASPSVAANSTTWGSKAEE